jgi:hypothetical protein
LLKGVVDGNWVTTLGLNKNREGGMSNRKFDGVHASYFLGFQQCRNCKETIYAAVGATRVPGGVLFKWRCDLCDHQFETVQSTVEGAAA